MRAGPNEQTQSLEVLRISPKVCQNRLNVLHGKFTALYEVDSSEVHERAHVGIAYQHR